MIGGKEPLQDRIDRALPLLREARDRLGERTKARKLIDKAIARLDPVDFGETLRAIFKSCYKANLKDLRMKGGR